MHSWFLSFMNFLNSISNFPPIHYYLLAWQRCFNYKGISNRREYWWALLIATLIQGIAGFTLLFTVNQVQVITIILGSLKIISHVQIIPLSIRRLRDNGVIKGKVTDLFFYLLVALGVLRLPKDNVPLSVLAGLLGVVLLVLYAQPSKKAPVNSGSQPET